MKKFILSFPVFLLFYQLPAQLTFNRAYHDTNEYPNPFVVAINGDTYFTSQNLDANDFQFPSFCYVYKHSASGSVIFRNQLQGYKTSYLGFKSLDDKLVLVGRNSFCDEVGPMQGFICKMDGDGSILSNATYTLGFMDNPKAAFQHSDSSYFVFTDSLLFKFNKAGQFVSRANLGVTEISSALSLSNGSILLSAKWGGFNSLLLISASTSVVSYSLFPVLMKKLSLYGGQKIMGLGTDEKLYKFRPDLSSMGSSLFSGGLMVSDFVCSKDTVYSLAYTSNNLAKYQIADTSFNSISLSATTTHSLSQQAICLNGSKAVILAAGISKSSYSFPQHYYVSLSQIDKLSDLNFTQDIALTSITSDSSYTGCYQIPFPPYDTKCSTVLRVRLTVKNNGTTPVTRFKLNCFKYPSLSCGGYIYQEQITGFSLVPGATLSLLSGLIVQSADPVNTYTFSKKYCFYVTLPNGETDKVVEDNEACITESFLINSIKGQSQQDVSVGVFPNPFESSLTIASDVIIKDVEVVNVLGMLVSTYRVNGKQYVVPSSELAMGIYFMKIETEKGMVIKKVLKH